MSMTPLFHVTLPDLDDNTEESHFAPLLFLLEGMILTNMWHIQRSLKKAMRGIGRPVPPLYQSGVRYAEDDAGREDWRDVYAILKRGRGDCDNLVAWRTAELRVAGVAADPVIKWRHIPYNLAVKLYPPNMISPNGLWMVHCCVRLPDGTIEDVSKNLGMGGGYTNRV